MQTQLNRLHYKSRQTVRESVCPTWIPTSKTNDVNDYDIETNSYNL